MSKLTRDDELWEACKRLWRSTIREKIYITGGIGSTCHGEAFWLPFDLPNDLAYAETCACIGLIFWARRMLEIEADSKYADVMEIALYNTVLSGMALDGKSFFYVNLLVVLPEACHKDEAKRHVKPVRQKWYGCACCPPHLTFPWNGKVTVTVRKVEEISMRLAMRIPCWCNNWDESKGVKGKLCSIEQGYFYLEGNWEQGDRIELDFPMFPRIMQADEGVHENIGKAAIMKGAIVYCMEEKDNGNNLQWNSFKPEEIIEQGNLEVQDKMFPTLLVKGKRRKQQLPIQSLYKEYHCTEYVDMQFTLIPYITWENRMKNEMAVWIDVLE